MGQANRRGPFEIRKAEAIVKNDAERERQATLRIQREAAITPEERKRRAKALRDWSYISGMAYPYMKLR